ncbi:PSP1-domain-containing protein [Neolentinus lepideus HHB14362 ss-1]|uniref:PSP1-domain-containing protein n=1 Tax=Neolentinus lepideus HHB14362 ss-1 TaxID=1314782 RepID=A0A165S4C5_9AGAM|nr:PSP1-domain-containing protein [Neolentinus lepideus HHB14362 ss-1]
MHEPNGHHQHQSDDADRTNRFLTLNHAQSSPLNQRERAASQPPRTGNPNLFSSLYRQTSFGAGGQAWGSGSTQQRFLPGLSPGSLPGLPSSVPTRSSSFSSSPSTSTLSSMMREQYRGGFPSTFEDDESEALSDTYDERFIPQSIPSRGRTYASDLSRSRSQSLATTRPTPIGSPYEHSGLGPSWTGESSYPNAQNITGSRYGDIRPPGSSRYGSLGPSSKASSHVHSFSPTGVDVGDGFSNRQSADISNMSPFMRDVEQILLDDGSAFRELWAGAHPPRDENGAGGSGTTSRRHSVSVVQPRRGVVGFNAPGFEGSEETTRSSVMHSSSFSGGGLLLTDDDLVGSLNMLNLNDNRPGPSSSNSQHPPSQPSSLPIYAPLSRHPPSQDRMSPYQQLNLNIPTNGGQYISRQAIRSPSENGYSTTGTSPARSSILEHGLDSPYQSSTRVLQLQSGENLISPSYGRPAYTSSALPTPVSPTATRAYQSGQQQQAFYTGSPGVQRRASNAELPTVSELGKGIPLSFVPPSCPLYIIEFKAGRTDLFYCTDLSLDIRVGDLVIVEADRGKDLGKVVNDSITLAEVEAFQKQQQAKNSAGYGDSSPTTPGGPGSGGKKDINPKRIYGKAQPQDTQSLVTKMQDEVKALQLCQSKVRQKKLPMEVIDAEYQWDRRKLTFYFIAEKRIDFRELVRELFRLYKTRIWMASLGGPGGYEQQ